MQISIADVLDGEQLAAAQDVLRECSFTDARASAGWAAMETKQARIALASPAVEVLRDQIRLALLAHPMFQLAAQPKVIIGPAFVRYGVGCSYGSHTDDPIMEGIRTDAAFTLFLSAPETYEGGALLIESAAGPEAIKLNAGALHLYPATSLHAVAPVTSGERLVAVGWVRSLIRDAARRELLFDLETARRSIFSTHGKTPAFDLMSKSAANLVRMWCED